jgi:hypothetical protein
LVDGLLARMPVSVDVRPYWPETNRRWFTHPEPAVDGVVGRDRVVVELRPATGPATAPASGPAPAEARGPRPEVPSPEREAFVPLARLVGQAGVVRTELAGERPAAIVSNSAELAALESLLVACASGVVELTTPIPFLLHDACRFGERSCLDAHRAIVDADGSIRPCSHGGRVGRAASDGMASFYARMEGLRAELEARRGCATCSAAGMCSRCAFPAALDETAYCSLIRRHAAALPRWFRLARMLVHRFPWADGAERMIVKLAPAERLVVATRRTGPGVQEDELASITARLLSGKAAIVVCDGDFFLDLPATRPLPLQDIGAAVLELAMEGMARGDIQECVGCGEDGVGEMIWFVDRWLG